MESRALLPGLLVGIGLAGTLDEVVLHQVLHWHHFYDRSTSAAGLVSDGLFHLASTTALVWGIALLLRRTGGWRRGDLAAVLMGAGGFNLYDATIQHKVLRLHQVRPAAPDQLPYDLTFGGIAVVVLFAGIALWRRPARTPG